MFNLRDCARGETAACTRQHAEPRLHTARETTRDDVVRHGAKNRKKQEAAAETVETVETLKMKVYFCGSIRGGRDDVHVYRRIVQKLQDYGTVLTEHVSSSELTDRGEDATAAGDRVIHDRDMDWLRQSDVIVAEVTQPSLGVGYELGRAVDMKKKIFCLFRPSSGRSLSAMIRGADDGELFVVRDYSEDEVENVLDEFFKNLKRS